MATTIDLTWYPDPAHVGGGVTFIVTLAPTPPAGAHVWIFVDGVNLGQLDILPGDDQISTYWSASSAGEYSVEAGFANLPAASGDIPDSDSTNLASLIVQAAPVPGIMPQPTQGLTSETVDVPLSEDAGTRIQPGSNAFNGVSNVDPFTGTPATDPYTGEPLSARDDSINDRIKAVYSQPDAVPESTRYAILDFYSKPGIDYTSVPQSVQNSILDIFSQVADPPLPGRGLDEFLSDTFSSVLGDLSNGLRSAVGTVSTVNDVIINADALALEATGLTLRPVFGAAQAIGGVAEIVGGVVTAVGSEGLGAGLGVAMTAHGLDQLIAGGRSMLGEDAKTLTQYILTDAIRPSFGTNASLVAGLMDGALSLGLNSAASFSEIGEIGLRSMSTEAAATRIELSQSTQLGEVNSIVGPAAGMVTEYSELSRTRIAFISSEWSAGTKAEQEVAAARESMMVVEDASLESGLLRPGNRLAIIHPTFTTSLPPEQEIQGALNDIVAKFAQNPALVGNYLTPGEIRGLLDTQAYARLGDWGDLNLQAPALFGKATERALAEAGGVTELLDSIGQLRGAGGRFVSSPDFRGLGPYWGLFFEITTNAALPDHLVKGYPVTTQYATYDIPVTWYFFLTP